MMADTFDKQKRSEIMSLVGSKNTRPEIIVRKFLHGNGIRYRLHDKKLKGSPDLKLTRYNTLVFINGCFWHAHNCEFYSMPKTNKKFWYDKVSKNSIRDKKNRRELKKLGWKVIDVWQCELKPNRRNRTLEKLLKRIKLDKN